MDYSQTLFKLLFWLSFLYSFFLIIRSSSQSSSGFWYTFLNFGKPAALCLLWAASAWALLPISYFEVSQSTFVSFEYLDMFNAVMAVVVALFYDASFCKRSWSRWVRGKGFLSYFYLIIFTYTLAFLPVAIGGANPVALSMVIVVIFSCATFINRIFWGNHWQNGNVFLTHRDEIFFDFLAFRSDYAINNPRAHRAYSETLFPTVFLICFTILASQLWAFDYNKSFGEYKKDNKDLLITWNELIAISDAKTLSDITKLNISHLKDPKFLKNPVAPEIYFDFTRTSYFLTPPEIYEDPNTYKDIKNEERYEQIVRENNKIPELLQKPEEAASPAQKAEAVVESGTQTPLIGYLIKNRVSSNRDVASGPYDISSEVLGLYFFKNILTLLIVCLTIWFFQMKNLRADYVSKWTKMSDRLHQLLKEDAKDFYQGAQWLQFAVDLIDTKMWGHRTFAPHFKRILEVHFEESRYRKNGEFVVFESQSEIKKQLERKMPQPLIYREDYSI